MRRVARDADLQERDDSYEPFGGVQKKIRRKIGESRRRKVGVCGDVIRVLEGG